MCVLLSTQYSKNRTLVCVILFLTIYMVALCCEMKLFVVDERGGSEVFCSREEKNLRYSNEIDLFLTLKPRCYMTI